MKREDYVFTVGYKGDQAIVDKRLRAKYKKLGTMELYNSKLLKQAAASAFWEVEQGNEGDLKELLERFKQDYNEDHTELSLRRSLGLTQSTATLNKVVAV